MMPLLLLLLLLRLFCCCCRCRCRCRCLGLGPVLLLKFHSKEEIRVDEMIGRGWLLRMLV
jgi:hypothetical protein